MYTCKKIVSVWSVNELLELHLRDNTESFTSSICNITAQTIV